jgi:hypothetical protein
LVVVGFVENGGHGSEVALPVVREVLNEAFPLESRGPESKPAPGDSGLGAREIPDAPAPR